MAILVLIRLLLVLLPAADALAQSAANLDICKLQGNPRAWNGKIVEVEGEVSAGFIDASRAIQLAGCPRQWLTLDDDTGYKKDLNTDPLSRALTQVDPATQVVTARLRGRLDTSNRDAPLLLIQAVLSVAFQPAKPPVDRQFADKVLAYRAQAVWKQLTAVLRSTTATKFYRDSLHEVAFPGGAMALQYFPAEIVSVNVEDKILVVVPFHNDLQVRLELTGWSESDLRRLNLGDPISFRGIITAFSDNPFLLTLHTGKQDLRFGPHPSLR